MNNTLLHNMNRTHTHIDVENGSFISLPKDGTDYPPVNADINNLITYGKTTGGEGTPDNPIPLINVSEWNKTVCGRNLFDAYAFRNVFVTGYNSYTTVLNSNSFYTTKSLSGQQQTSGFAFNIKPNIDYTLSFNFDWQPIVEGGAVLNPLVWVYDITNGLVVQYGGIQRIKNTNIGTSKGQKTITYNFSAGVNKIAIVVNNYISVIDNNYHGVAGITYSDIQFQEGAATPYTPYQGNTYPYKLEDVNDIVHNFGSLPDGTADTYNRDNNLFTQRLVKAVLNGTENWTIIPSFETATRICLMSGTIPNYTFLQSYMTSIDHYSNTHFTKSLTGLGVNLADNICRLTDFFYVAISKTLATDVATFKTWLTSNNITLLYPLARPFTFQIKPYSAEFLYNEKPKSIQYHTNIFNDAGLEMQCEVRKLGNRKMSEFYWITENGDRIITEDGDYIMLEY